MSEPKKHPKIARYSQGGDADRRSLYATSSTVSYQDPKSYTSYKDGLLDVNNASYPQNRKLTTRDLNPKMPQPACDGGEHDSSGFARNHPSVPPPPTIRQTMDTTSGIASRLPQFDLTRPLTAGDGWSDMRHSFGGFKSACMQDPYRHPIRPSLYAAKRPTHQTHTVEAENGGYGPRPYTTTATVSYQPPDQTLNKEGSPKAPAGLPGSGWATPANAIFPDALKKNTGTPQTVYQEFADNTRKWRPRVTPVSARGGDQLSLENGFSRAVRLVPLGYERTPYVTNNLESYQGRQGEGNLAQDNGYKPSGFATNFRCNNVTGDRGASALSRSTESRDNYTDHNYLLEANNERLQQDSNQYSRADGFTRSVSTGSDLLAPLPVLAQTSNSPLHPSVVRKQMLMDPYSHGNVTVKIGHR